MSRFVINYVVTRTSPAHSLSCKTNQLLNIFRAKPVGSILHFSLQNKLTALNANFTRTRFGSVSFSLHCLWHERVMSFPCVFCKDERQQVGWKVCFRVSNSYVAYMDEGFFLKFWPKNVRHFFQDYLASGNVTKWEYKNRFFIRCFLTEYTVYWTVPF